MTGDTDLPCHDQQTSAALKQLHGILTTRAFLPSAAPGAARTAAVEDARAHAPTLGVGTCADVSQAA